MGVRAAVEHEYQQQLRSSFVFGLAYGASKGTHLPFGSLQIDQLPDADLALGTALTASVPNPFYGVINPTYSLGAPTITAGQLLIAYPQYNGVSVAAAGKANSTSRLPAARNRSTALRKALLSTSRIPGLS